jgi:hypothetical protein
LRDLKEQSRQHTSKKRHISALWVKNEYIIVPFWWKVESEKREAKSGFPDLREEDEDLIHAVLLA